jgi:hypothetical protein
MHRPHKVHVDDAPEFLFRHLIKGGVLRDPGVIYPSIDATKAVYRSTRQVLDLLRIADVAWRRQRFLTRLTDRMGKLIDRFHAARANYGVCTFVGKMLYVT